MKSLEKIFVSKQDTMEDAVRAIQEGHEGIALVVEKKRTLIATITDGDIRRAILNRISPNEPISKLLLSRGKDYPKPLVAPYGISDDELLELMEKKLIRQIPIIDKEGRVIDIALLNDLIEKEHSLPLKAVIMAGGRGQRLYPLTKDLPKPMLEINQAPILQRIVEQLKSNGISDIYIATNYHAQVIQKHFGEGKKFGVNILYINEEKPLGTSGALGLIRPVPEGPVLVINGDIITELNFHVMYDFHCFHKSDLTMGVRIYETEIPFGVIETDDIYVKRLTEKPVHASIVNAGIYILNPDVFQYIPQNQYFDMTDLIESLLKNQKSVVSFPIQEYWLDIGRPSDYTRAKIDATNGNFKFDGGD